MKKHLLLATRPKIPGEVRDTNLATRPSDNVKTRSSLIEVADLALISEIEPNGFDEALTNEGWVLAMHGELNQIKRNDIWDLIPLLDDTHAVGTKWGSQEQA